MTNPQLEWLLRYTELGDLTQRVQQYVTKIESTVTRLWDAVEAVLEWLGPAAETVVRLLGKLADLIKKVYDVLNRLITQPGNPVTLMNCADTWTGGAFGGRMSGYAAAATKNQRRAADKWVGDAGLAYQSMLLAQEGAFKKWADIATAVDDALKKLAGAIAAVLVAIIAAASPYLLELTVALFTALTGVGVPAALSGATISTTKVLGLLGAALAGIVAFVSSEVVPAFSKLRQLHHDNSAFPDGTWPRTVDGYTADKSGWELRPSSKQPK